LADYFNMSVRPGLSVKIVVDVDQRNGRINALNSTIYDVTPGLLILAQTEPPIKSSMLNRKIVVTYLETKNGQVSRYGFSAHVLELIDQYELAPNHYARAIALNEQAEPRPYDIRMCYRVGPSSKSGLNASISGAKINVIDISIGGLRFSYDRNPTLKPDIQVEVSLAIEKAIHIIKARIIRTWEAESPRFGGARHFAAAEFLEVNAKTEQALSRKILDIERESRFF